VTVIAAASANAVVPGVLGFLVVAGMGLALFFLLRSMNKQLRKISPNAGPRTAAAAHSNASAPGKDGPDGQAPPSGSPADAGQG
jgi:hypothetical protein